MRQESIEVMIIWKMHSSLRPPLVEVEDVEIEVEGDEVELEVDLKQHT